MRYIFFTLLLTSLLFATDLKIFPSSAVMKPGTTLNFSAVAYDNDGSMYTPQVSWRSDYGTAHQGRFTAPSQPGNYTVTARWGGYSARAQIQVKQPYNAIQKIVITPSYNKVAVSGNIRFKAIAYDSYGRVVNLKSTKWWCDGGTIDRNGYFTAGYRPGSYNVWVQDTYSGIKVSARIDVIRKVVQQPKISRIQITPYVQTVNVGSYQQFKAVAYDSYSRPVSCNFTWSCDYGTVSSTGYFQAGNRPGTCKVWAKDPYGGASGYVSFRIIRGVVQHPPANNRISKIAITPRNQRVSVGQSVQLKAIGYDSYGRQVNFSPKWWTNYGTIDQSGYYRAYHKPGRYEIFVKARRSNVQTSTFVEVVRKVIGHPPHNNHPKARIDVTYWDVDGGSIFHRSKIKVKFIAKGKRVQKAALYGIYRSKKTVELKSASCYNGQELYFKTKFAHQISKLEIRLYDSYGEIIARYSASAK